MGDSFNTALFKQTFQRVFAKDSRGEYTIAFDATLKVQTSRELKVCGLIGPSVSLAQNDGTVSENEIGIGGTTAWRMCAIDPRMAYGIFFDVANQHSQPVAPGQRGVIQFTTQYQVGVEACCCMAASSKAGTHIWYPRAALCWPASSACDHRGA